MRPASIASTFAPRGDHRAERPHADGRHIEPHVLLRLGDFDDREAASLAEPAGAVDAGVGAFDRLDREYRLVLHANALADVEPTHFAGDLPAEFDVVLLRGRWRPARDLARLHQAVPVRSRSPDET